MSSVVNNAELSGSRQLPADSSDTTNQDAASTSADMNSRAEVVEGLDLVPVAPGSTWLKHDSVNEYVQLFNPVYHHNGYTIIDCRLPSILKEHGDPLATAYYLCNCDDDEDHTCWLSREYCGTRGKHGRRRNKLVRAFEDAIDALQDGLLQMYRDSTRWAGDHGSNARQAGPLTPGLHKLATMRLSSLTNGVKRLQEYHNRKLNTVTDGSKVASSAGDDATAEDESVDDESSDDSKADGGDEDLANLERRLLACKTSLLTPLEGVPDTKASIIKATQDLKLATRDYDVVVIGPRSTVREYYGQCVLKVADAHPSLEHYGRHPICDGLFCDLKEIDNGYRKARKDLYWLARGDEDWEEELSDGLGKILRSLWDKTRCQFESGDIFMPGLSRPGDLCLDDDAWLDSLGDPDENTEDY